MTRGLVFIFSLCALACGEPLEAPVPSVVAPSAALPDGGVGLPAVPTVLFPAQVQVDTPEALVTALGLVLCKFQYGCCDVSLGDADAEVRCAPAIQELLGLMDSEIDGVNTGRVAFSAERARQCATAALGYINGAISNGACSRSLEGVAASPFGVAGPQLGAYLESGFSFSGLLYSGLLCLQGVFSPLGETGDDCLVTDAEGDTFGSSSLCREGLFCQSDVNDTVARCAARIGLGGACRQYYDECVADAFCRVGPDGENGQCEAQIETGAACTDFDECVDYGECVNGVCIVESEGIFGNGVGNPCLQNRECASGKCDARGGICLPSTFLTVGAACAEPAPDAACALGLVCDESAEAPVCVQPTARAGEACARDADCVGRLCLSNGTCAGTLADACVDLVGDSAGGSASADEEDF